MNPQTQPKHPPLLRRNYYIPAFVIFRNAAGPIQEESYDEE